LKHRKSKDNGTQINADKKGFLFITLIKLKILQTLNPKICVLTCPAGKNNNTGKTLWPESL